MPKVLLIAWERFSEIKHAFTDKQYQLEEIQELMCKLLEDVGNINEELSEFTNSMSWDRPMIFDDVEHSIQFSTIPETESKELIKSSVKNLVPILSEYEATSNNESKCDVTVKDESSPIFTTFSYPLFDCNDDFTSSDDESLSNEDVSMENFNIYSNPLFNDEEIISNKIDLHYFNVEFNLIESLPNRDTLFDSSPIFDYHEEFSGDLMPTSIINEGHIKREHKEYITPIPIEDSDSLREEIDIFTGTDDLMHPGIEKPSDVEVFFEPDSGVLTTKVVKGISKHYVLMPNILPTLSTFDPLYPVYDTLLLFSSKNEDKVFKPSILSYLLVSHRDKITFDFSENSTMTYGGDIPLLDVLYLHFYPP
nr:hypothetical protein [Tanacetum cinerariifolium]